MSSSHRIHTRQKLAVLARDGYQCRYCGAVKGVLTFDHVVSVASGGKSHALNVVVACRPCNMAKGDQCMEEAGLQLRPVPDAPVPRERGLSLPARKERWRGWTRLEAEVILRDRIPQRSPDAH